MQTNIKIGIAVVVIAAIAVGLGYAFLGGEPSETIEENEGKIGLVLATGGLGDQSFNDLSYRGAKEAAEEFNYELDYVEPESVSEFETYQRQYAETGEYDLIICIGFDQASALSKVASDYPDQKFAIVDSTAEGENNVASLLFNDWEEAFLAGVTAGKMTETNKVGIEGGMDIPLINNFVMGYRQGVLWANDQMDNDDVLVRYVGGWSDVATGKSLAEAMYSEGADIIYGAAGRSHLGVFQAAQEADNRWAIGTDVDQSWSTDYEDVILASGLKRVDLAVHNQIKKVANNNFESGVVSYGMAEGAVGVGTGIAIGDENINPYIRAASDSGVEIPENVIDSIEEAVQKIRNGTIQIEHT